MVWLAVATGCARLDCGEGTLEQDGECVSTWSCGPGTERIDGECVVLPDEDPEPEPDPVVCGPGTVLVDGACVPEEDLECGEGTVQRGDTCVPLTTQYVWLPYDPGTALPVSQGHHGPLSHNGIGAFAVDFSADEGTSIRAMRGGRVLAAYDGSDTGCGSVACADEANYVLIDHGDATVGLYYHLELGGALVDAGELVGAGTPIGLSGNTGFSTGPHIHVEIRDLFYQSLPLRFEELLDEAGGVISYGMEIVSENEEVPPSDVAYSDCPADTFAFLGVFLDPGVPCTSVEAALTSSVSGFTTVGTDLLVARYGTLGWLYSCVPAPGGSFDYELGFGEEGGFGDTSYLVFSAAFGADCQSYQGWESSPEIWLR